MISYPIPFIIGIIILVFLSYDLFRTIAQASEGPAARLVQGLSQRLLTGLYRLTGKRSFLTWSSSLLILSLVLTWVILLYSGWLFIFVSDPLAIVQDADLSPATFSDRVYFTGFTISTLGVGDYVPKGGFWQFMTTLCALSGFFFLTFIISFLVSVVQKQALRRKLALHINYIGETPQAILTRNWNPSEKNFLGDVLEDIFADVVQFQQQQLDQPILNRFHGPSENRSVELSLVVLDEALTLAQVAVSVPLPTQFVQVRDALTDYLDSLENMRLASVESPPPIPEFDPLEVHDIPLRDKHFVTSEYNKLKDRRCKLRALVQSTGWEWEKVTKSYPDQL